jgi:hypothetical protein
LKPHLWLSVLASIITKSSLRFFPAYCVAFIRIKRWQITDQYSRYRKQFAHQTKTTRLQSIDVLVKPLNDCTRKDLLCVVEIWA